jgi:hypothetical protein
MARQPEGRLVAKIKTFVTKEGGRPFKIMGSDESFQEVGIPDLLICFQGWFVGAEVKQRGESLRPTQRVILHEIYQAGGAAAVLETVKQAELLLSYLKHRRNSEGPICYDRGVMRRRCEFQ